MLNHQLRNVQKLIMISWHLQNRSVTESLAVELKSSCKLKLSGAAAVSFESESLSFSVYMKGVSAKYSSWTGLNLMFGLLR